ncbi:protein DCL, chloroplastic-like [Vicia villosa]|uniref:protein DCL, chloroplastic-like n=1 Tax=Vicia villosa TaxID=3911 RepID=UPI00273AB3F5|nr:protein DCL, chloroplastic-like [Vicia villosa]
MIKDSVLIGLDYYNIIRPSTTRRTKTETFNLKTPLHFHSFKNPFSSRFILSLSYSFNNPRLFHSAFSSLKVVAASSDCADNLLEKSVISQWKGIGEEHCYEQEQDDNTKEEYKWVDLENQILEDVVPLVEFVKMILHSGLYEYGDRLNQEHEKIILEKLIPFHPESDKKIGCGVDYITIGCHPDFNDSRCMFIVQKDGKMVDFSYWKCIKGLIGKNYS